MPALPSLWRYLWAGPATCLGLLFAPVAWLSGGTVRRVGGCIEIHGGLVAGFLRRRVPIPGGASALTLGHVVLGRSQRCLDDSRQHERIHVRQYERWGPFFIPAYVLASLFAALRGGQAYRDNRFEREAFETTGGSRGFSGERRSPEIPS